MKLNKKLFGRSLYKIATILFLVGYNFAPAAFAIGDISKLEVKQDQSVSVTTEETSEVLNEVPVDTSEDIHEKGISDPEGIAKGEDLVEKEVWSFSGKKAITSAPVVVNEKYVFPGNSGVSVVFSKLPNTPSTLSMEEIILTDEEVKATGAISKKAYDINTDMEDGTFEYDLTLPNLGVSGKVAYAEDRKELMTDLKEVTNKVVNVQGSLKVEGLDHFSIYIITNPPAQAPKVSSDGGTNYSSSVTVTAGDVIKVKLNVKVGDSYSDSWRSTSYRISGVMKNDFCVNHDDHDGNGTYTETFDITAPPLEGTYNLDLKAHRNDNCDNTLSSSSYTLNNAIKVSSIPSLEEPVANPVVPASCGLDIALVIDNSNSIDKTELNKMKDAMKAFVNSLKGTPTRFSVTKFGTNASVLQGFTSDTDSVIAAINSVNLRGGGTNWEEGIRYARGTFAQGATGNPDLMVFASDGNPTYPFCGGSNTCDLDVNAAVIEANKAKQQGIRMLALGIGNGLSVENLNKISGPIVNAPTILESDVITANFDTMASKLRDLAIQSCGQKISVNKFVEENGQTNPGGAGWKFTVTGPTNTTLTTNNQGQDTTETLNIGTYSIVESNMLDGYSYKSAECKKNGISIGNVIEKGIANIVIGYGDIITCDFTNKKQEAELTLVKVVTNDNGGTASPSDFTLKAGDITFVSGILQKVNTGTYSLSESGPDGYSPSNWVCTGTGTQNGSNITLEDGQSAVCTITNDDIAPKLTLVKRVINDNGGTALPSNFTLKAGDITFVSDEAQDVAVGTYALSETGPNGYLPSDWVCEGGTQSGSNIKLELGQSATCTITNDDIAPKLTVTKVVENGLFGDKTITDFPLFVGNTSVVSGEQNTFNVGSYVVSETNPEGSGYTSAISGDCAEDGSVTLALGEEKVCTITNTSIWSKITVKKLVLPSSDSTKFTFTGALAGEIGNEETISKVVLPGTYTTTETVPTTGWKLTDITCTSGGSGDLETGVASYVVGNNEEVTCTYTNTKLGSISGYKYEDKDNDSTTGDDRSPVSGWTITLKDSDGNVIDTTKTVIDGSYEFTDLLPGEYTVTEGKEIGWIVLVGDSHNVTLDAGENEQNVNFVNVKLGSIRVLKNVDGNGDGDLLDDVDTRGSTEWNWTLNGVNVGSTGSTKPELEPGTYTIKETGGLDNFHFLSLSCTGGKNITIHNDTATVVLESGEDVTCTYTNARNLGQLIVKKVVVNDNGGNLEAKDFSFTINGGTPIQFEDDGQNEFTRYAGLSYNIVEVEANQRGYTTTYDNCTDVTVPYGETAACTITNNDIAPGLTIKKHVKNDNGGTATVGDFGITLTGTELTFDGGVTRGTTTTYTANPTVVSNKKYTVSEGDHPGYAEGDWSCVDDNNPATEISNTFTLSEGQSITCEVRNDDIAPVLILDKEVDNKDIPQDLRQTASSWTLTATGPTSLSGQGKDNDSEDVKSGNLFRAGTYTLSETEDIPGFKSINGWVCTDAQGNEVQHGENEDQVTLNPGDVVTCKIVNESVHGKIIIKKVVEPNTDDKEFEFKIDDVVTGEIGHGGELSKVVTAGSYSISETVPEEGDWNLRDVTCSNEGSTWSENTVRISVADNETVTCTFTNEKLGKISGYKYEDKNGNGKWDSGEVALANWGILSKDQYGNVKTVTTGADGYYEFINLPVGNRYIITEINQVGWKQTSENPAPITIAAGSDVKNVNFGNFENVTISVTKYVVGIDGVTDVADSTEFESLLNGADAKTIAEGTTATYTVIDPGTYSVTESVNTDYDYIGCFLGDNAFSDYSVESGQTYNVVCKNKQKPATLIVNKSVIDSENNDDGVFSEDEFDVVLGEETKQIADKEGGKVKAEFGGLQPGDYTFTETPKDGYIFDGCTNDGEVTLGSNKTVEVTCTNRIIDPILEIEKSNNAAVTGQKAGDIVEYTITVTAPDDGAEGKYILKNVVVSDIAPAGFKYISGTWEVYGAGIVIPEPTYNGTYRAQWMLGEMKEGDKIVLTYKTQISLRTDPGVYPDIAWVKGISLSGTNVLGNVSTGAGTPFVGTEVKVIEDDIVEEGEVLGASITLPNTGASTYLTLGALIMMILGAISLLFKPFKKLNYALLASVMMFGMFAAILPTKVSAGFLTVKIETPTSPTTKKTFNIDFTAQDVEERDITVECYKDAVKFASFDKVNAGACPVTVDASGTYKFFVKAIAGADEKQSNEITVEVIDKPLPVIDYSKAGNVLKFKTANDAKIVKVEIHRSDKPSYTANDTTKIHTMNVAPNTAYSWTDASAEPGKTYYYALRSLDAFGNVSTMVSDQVEKPAEEITTPASSTSGATVAGTKTTQEGEVKGDTDKEEPKEVEQVQDGKENPQPEKEGEEKEVELTPSYKKYWYIWVPAILLVLGVGYMYVKRSKEE